MNESTEEQNLQAAGDARLEVLELKMMELENTVTELNEVVISQYRDIDRLKAGIERLEQRISSSAESASASDPAAEPPPPHY